MLHASVIWSHMHTCRAYAICKSDIHFPQSLLLTLCRQGYRPHDQKPWEDRTQPLVSFIAALLHITICVDDFTLSIAWQRQPSIRPKAPDLSFYHHHLVQARLPKHLPQFMSQYKAR